MGEAKNHRKIIHIDMDAFYASAGVSSNKPKPAPLICVLNWAQRKSDYVLSINLIVLSVELVLNRGYLMSTIEFVCYF